MSSESQQLLEMCLYLHFHLQPQILNLQPFPHADWLNGKEWDTVMNYDAFMEPITWFLTGMEKHSDDFRGDLLGNSDSFFQAMSSCPHG